MKKVLPVKRAEDVKNNGRYPSAASLPCVARRRAGA